MSDVTTQEKQNVVASNVKQSVNIGGSRMDVPYALFKFPPIDGIQQKVTLKSNKTGEFMNIGFEEGVDNTIAGNMADKLIESFPNTFDVIKVNGQPYMKGADNIKEKEMFGRFMGQLQEQYDLVPKKKPDVKESKRDRPEEKATVEGTSSKDSKIKNSFTKE